MTHSPAEEAGPRVAVIGGGLAGLAAAAAAAEHGLQVELFEARRRLGGRAGSFRDRQSGELVDRCQHVAMGCCTNLADFCRRARIDRHFLRQRRLHFVSPAGVRYALSAGWLLPAPLHLAPGLMRLGYLSVSDRLRIVRTIGRLARLPAQAFGGASQMSRRWQDDDRQTIGSWLRQQGESDRAIQRFWSVVLASALGETLDRASLAAARKVFVDAFLASRRAYELVIPQLPLAELYDRLLGEWLIRQKVIVHRGTRIKQIDGDASGAAAVVLPDGSRRHFDFFVVAVPWRDVQALFPEAMARALPALEGVRRIESAPITAVHLWFDRPIMPLPNAAIVGCLSQWIFRCGRHAVGCGGSTPGHQRRRHTACACYHYQVVISGSRELAAGRRDVLAQVQEELRAIWPAAREPRLLRWRMITQPAAVFSARPGVERYRPGQSTPIRNLMLAGDWTATGWPATMESAVRSGYLAAEAILKALGHDVRLLVPDLPRSRLARRLIATRGQP